MSAKVRNKHVIGKLHSYKIKCYYKILSDNTGFHHKKGKALPGYCREGAGMDPDQGEGVEIHFSSLHSCHLLLPLHFHRRFCRRPYLLYHLKINTISNRYLSMHVLIKQLLNKPICIISKLTF